MAKYDYGFKFEVKENGIVGIIGDSIQNEHFGKERLYSVHFYENGKHYYSCTVFESTIDNNLKLGVYIEK